MLGLKIGDRVQYISRNATETEVGYTGGIGTVVDIITTLRGDRSAIVHWDSQPERDTSPTVANNLRILPAATPKQ